MTHQNGDDTMTPEAEQRMLHAIERLQRPWWTRPSTLIPVLGLTGTLLAAWGCAVWHVSYLSQRQEENTRRLDRHDIELHNLRIELRSDLQDSTLRLSSEIDNVGARLRLQTGQFIGLRGTSSLEKSNRP